MPATKTTLELVEQTLLELLINDQVTITRVALAEEAGVHPNSVTRANTVLSSTGRWDIALGYGRSETRYHYLGK